MLRAPGQRHARAWPVIVLLSVDAVLLATLELFYLPLRLDGVVLPDAGDAPLPLSALVAAVTTPLLVTTAERLASRRLAVVPLLVWFLTLLVLGVAGPGGDNVLLIDWRALLLFAGGALPAAIALGGSLGRTAALSART
ncbi:hypothetical protein AB8O38_20695 [Saccharomonospora xinjiangensis]|uniref:MFS transporter n=1 Tax=Saccharomonospora xinjiangensis XJ-54 TaxID=882086 RepID=I0V550_9PSEU|nr:hypothetical protein [Saccharomonospora xinjiangensis]EID55253.1 hypothetical protein SacxiDRAFT_3043 [Saccharomonospora xinjiangensis XJ-54]